jgi:hypothetical protein
LGGTHGHVRTFVFGKASQKECGRILAGQTFVLGFGRPGFLRGAGGKLGDGDDSVGAFGEGQGGNFDDFFELINGTEGLLYNQAVRVKKVSDKSLSSKEARRRTSS